MAKPLKRSVWEERYNLYLDYLRRGKLPKKAAREVKIPLEDIAERRKTDPVFRQREKDAIAEFSEDVEQVLIDAAFGVVHYATDPNGEPVYETFIAKDGTVQRERAIARRDTKAAEVWLKARNSAIFNIDKAVQRHEMTHTIDVKELFGDIGKLREALEGRMAPLELESAEILDAEVLSDQEVDP